MPKKKGRKVEVVAKDLDTLIAEEEAKKQELAAKQSGQPNKVTTANLTAGQ